MKVFVLHLERSTDRKKHMMEEVKKHHLDYEIFPAFDCLGLTDEDLSEFCDMETVKRLSNYLTPGMVCASKSHYLIYQKIIEENLDCALIVEDDVVFDRNIISVLDNIEKNINPNEVILLHYMSWEPLTLLNERSVPVSDIFTIYESKENFPFVNSAAGYIVTKDAAKTLSEYVMPIKNGTDNWAKFLEDGGFNSLRFVYPRPIDVAGFKSNATPGKNKLWNFVTSIIDKYKIPFLFSYFRTARLKSVESRSKIVVE